MRFVHTSDWQIGKTFRIAGDAADVLRDERLEAITRLGDLARAQGATDVLVAGDVYDIEVPSDRTLRQPIEKMRACDTVQWHLIPGNHDAHTARGPWERLRTLRDGLPANIHLHLAPEPAPVAGGAAVLLPAVLTRRHVTEDPTAWMDDAATPEGAIRIGLAHGSIASFGTDADATPNRIDPARPDRAGLSYLALGDWHGAKEISPRCRYSGTPEVDGFDLGGDGGGSAFVVDVEAPRAPPVISTHAIGRFAWHKLNAALHGGGDIDVLETRLRALAPDLGAVLVQLTVSGALSLDEREAFEDRIRHGLGSALRVLRLDDAALLPKPTAADLESIDHAGFVRSAADRLTARAGDEADPQRDLAAAALQRLFVLSKQAPRGARP